MATAPEVRPSKRKTMCAGALLLSLLIPTALSGAFAQNLSKPRVRLYYIAAEDVMWNYAPGGRNLTGTPGPENEAGINSTTYRKAVYHEYTDGTFTTLKPRPPEWEHLGILGPLIRAEVGDVVKVVFKNNTKFFCSMHPHGLASIKE